MVKLALIIPLYSALVTILLQGNDLVCNGVEHDVESYNISIKPQ
jgi:hypothetical protein